MIQVFNAAYRHGVGKPRASGDDPDLVWPDDLIRE